MSLKREEIMDMMLDAKPVELREYCRLVTQLLTESQINRIQPFFIQRVDFDYKMAMEMNQKPIISSPKKEKVKQDPNLMVGDIDIDEARRMYGQAEEEEDPDGEEEEDPEDDGDTQDDEDDDEYNVESSR